MDPWAVLGVTRDASDDDVRTRYRELVRQFHPDQFTAGSEEQAEALRRMPEINAAYEILTKTSARIAHEQTMARRRAHERRAAEAAGRARPEPPDAPVRMGASERTTRPRDPEPARQSSGRFDYRSRAASEFEVRPDEGPPPSMPPRRSPPSSPPRRPPPPPPVEFFAMGTGTTTPKPPSPPAAPQPPPPDRPGRLRRWFKGDE